MKRLSWTSVVWHHRQIRNLVLQCTWTSIWLHLTRFSNRKMTEWFCILAPRPKTVVIMIIITKRKNTIRCLFCLSLSLFSLRRLLYASYKTTKSSVATNFYLHCNAILYGLGGSGRGGGEREGRGEGGEGRGRGGEEGRGEGGKEYTQHVSGKTNGST